VTPPGLNDTRRPPKPNCAPHGRRMNAGARVMGLRAAAGAVVTAEKSAFTPVGPPLLASSSPGADAFCAPAKPHAPQHRAGTLEVAR